MRASFWSLVFTNILVITCFCICIYLNICVITKYLGNTSKQFGNYPNSLVNTRKHFGNYPEIVIQLGKYRFALTSNNLVILEQFVFWGGCLNLLKMQISELCYKNVNLFDFEEFGAYFYMNLHIFYFNSCSLVYIQCILLYSP